MRPRGKRFGLFLPMARPLSPRGAKPSRALLQAKDPSLAATLHSLVRDPSLGGLAIRALSAYDDPATPDLLITAYSSLGRRSDAMP